MNISIFYTIGGKQADGPSADKWPPSPIISESSQVRCRPFITLSPALLNSCCNYSEIPPKNNKKKLKYLDPFLSIKPLDNTVNSSVVLFFFTIVSLTKCSNQITYFYLNYMGNSILFPLCHIRCDPRSNSKHLK